MRMEAYFRISCSVIVLVAVLSVLPAAGGSVDLRGVWVGKAQGPIFGAEGSVTITNQRGEDIVGIVEGGNVLGKARFGIRGKVKGNAIVGSKDGHQFQGFLYPDGTIRGAMHATNGEVYKVFLRRPYSYWGGGTPNGAPFALPYGLPYGTPYGTPYGSW